VSFRTALLPVVDEIRSIAGPMGFDIRTSHLTIRTRVWSGGRAGLGSPHDEDIVLAPHYKVSQLSAREVASSGGRFELEDVRVGPITPKEGDTGYSLSELAPDGSDGVEILYILTGPHDGEYGLVQAIKSRPFRYELVLRRRRRTP